MEPRSPFACSHGGWPVTHAYTSGERQMPVASGSVFLPSRHGRLRACRTYRALILPAGPVGESSGTSLGC